MKFSNYNIMISFITMVLAMAYAMRSVSVDRYRSAYSAYETANVTLIGRIVFFLIYSVVFGFTPLPIIVLGLVWSGQNMAYHREVNKQYQ